MGIVKTLLPIHSASWHVVTTSVSLMVNEVSDTERNRMINNWRSEMLSQLSNVEIIGAITSAAVVGAFTWTSLEKLSPVADAMVRVLWYSSLVLGIGAVALSVHQSVFLMRIGCLPQANDIIRRILARPGRHGQLVPRGDQLFLWQAAVGLLEFSIYTWLAGFVALIGDVTRTGSSHPGKGNQVVAGFCFFAIIATVATYLLSMIRLWCMAERVLTKIP